MNIDAAIEIHRTALLRLLTMMYAAIGVEDGGSVGVVREHVRLMVLRMLGPAESAGRRLVFLWARRMPDEEYVRGPARSKTEKRKTARKPSQAFVLFDPRKKSGNSRKKKPNGSGPRILFLDETDPPYSPDTGAQKTSPDDMVSADNLCARLSALFRALGDLDKQARRLKRAEARRKLLPRLSLQGVLRINTPPGHRKKGGSAAERAVDDILYECHVLARRWIAQQDTS